MPAKPTAAFLLANLLMDARDLHQSTYDFAEYLRDLDKTQKEKQRGRRQDPQDPQADLYVNYTKANYHKLDYMQAAVQVCADVEPELAEAVCYLMTGSWNESGEWARKLTGRDDVKCAAALSFEADMDVIYAKYADTQPHPA